MQGGAGFRTFLTRKCKVNRIHDMVRLTPFENAVNRTSLLSLERGKTVFPVSSVTWDKKRGGALDESLSLSEARELTTRTEMVMKPIEGVGKPQSSWLIATPRAANAVEKVVGRSNYEAQAASNTRGANSVFWVKLLEAHKDTVVIQNDIETGRTIHQLKTVLVENDLVYPLLRGRDVSKWVAVPSGHIIVPHDRKTGHVIPEKEFKINYPKAFSYFATFKDDLDKRKLYGEAIKGSQPFYTLFQTSKGLFYPYKVVWKEIAGEISGKGEFHCSVVERVDDEALGPKTVIPDHKLMYIPFTTPDEAYYVASVLNSTPVRLVVASYTIETSMSTHIMKNVRVPDFNPTDPIHGELVQLSRTAHKSASKAQEGPGKAEDRIDRLVASLYGLNEEELAAMKESLTLM
jgi:hypothetical protein